MSRIVIIGAGASGLICSIFAKRSSPSADVFLLEKNDRAARKLLATGNGRCNFTNTETSPERFYGQDSSFSAFALDSFTPRDAVEFFAGIGVYAKTESEGRVYPYSNSAASVVDALRFEAERLGVEIKTGFEVDAIKKTKTGFDITGENRVLANKAVIACGGCAHPELGSNGAGFRLLASLGHEITSLAPSLVQVKTEKTPLNGLSGLRAHAELTLLRDGTRISSERGELLFTDYGLSGIAIMNLSRFLNVRARFELEIDLMPELSHEQVRLLLERTKSAIGHLTAEYFLSGIFAKKMGQAICKISGIGKLSVLTRELSGAQIASIASSIKASRVLLLGTNGFTNAQITSGGAKTDQFDPRTMESRIHPGLFACGEVLDIAGECGGFNLHWCWASGRLAGINSASCYSVN